MQDVIVVGGGLAGLYAAALLAGEGLEVTVLEEHETIGAPTHCTGLVSTEVWALYKPPEEVILHRPARCRVVSPGGAVAEFESPSDELAVVDRGAFDRSLADWAVEAGARIVTGCRVHDVDLGPRQVTVHANESRFRTRAVVIAAGAAYRFLPLVGARPPAVLQTAQVEVAARPAESLEIHLGRDLAPEGFAWLVPVRRNGSGTFLKAGVLMHGNARAHLQRFIERPDVADRLLEAAGEPVRRPIPVAPVARSYGERTVIVGDAAGLTKPVTGGGIFYSLVSAAMAAETLTEALRANDLRANRLAAYESRWRSRLSLEIRSGLWFRWLLACLSNAQLDRLVETANSRPVREIIARTARFNWHRSVILAMLRSPGIRSVLLRNPFR